MSRRTSRVTKHLLCRLLPHSTCAVGYCIIGLGILVCLSSNAITYISFHIGNKFQFYTSKYFPSVTAVLTVVHLLKDLKIPISTDHWGLV